MSKLRRENYGANDFREFLDDKEIYCCAKLEYLNEKGELVWGSYQIGPKDESFLWDPSSGEKIIALNDDIQLQWSFRSS